MLPLVVAHLTASYTRQWVPFCNLTVVWLTSMLSYFTIDLSDEENEPNINNQSTLTICVENKETSWHRYWLKTWSGYWLPWTLSLGYPLLMYCVFGTLESVAHYAAIVFMFHQLPRQFPQSFTFAEAFIVVGLITTYAHYGLL